MSAEGMDITVDVPACARALSEATPYVLRGRISRVRGLIVESRGPVSKVGDVCQIWACGRETPVLAEVVGFSDGKVMLLPVSSGNGIAPGCRVDSTGGGLEVGVGESLLGRVLDALGQPIDEGPPLKPDDSYPLDNEPPPPLSRQSIKRPLGVGIKAIDAFLTCGRGQRMGIFAGSGVGKSTLMGMMARNTEADVAVVALIGERGRELQEFVENDLGPKGLSRSVVVAATSDQPPLLRMKAAQTAVTVAEYFRDRGAHVVLLMDSLTRYALACREVGLAAGEPPTTRGYPPSAFALMPRLLERCGTGPAGSITGFFAVLVEGDDFNEPVADAARSILDGHVVLDRKLAARNHYPPIDVLGSVSRLMPAVADQEHQAAAGLVREILAVHRDAEDLINIGAYRGGSNPEIDRALFFLPRIRSFLRQRPDQVHPLAETQESLGIMAADIEGWQPGEEPAL